MIDCALHVFRLSIVGLHFFKIRFLPFIDQHVWKYLSNNFPSNKNDSYEFEKNNKKVALNILYLPDNTEAIRHAYKLKHNLKCKNQVLLLMITDGEKWHYLSVKKLSALLREITSKHD